MQLHIFPRNYKAEPHLWQRMSSCWVRNSWPTRETEHFAQLKHSPCHWRSSNEMYLAPPRAEREYDKKRRSESSVSGHGSVMQQMTFWCVIRLSFINQTDKWTKIHIRIRKYSLLAELKNNFKINAVRSISSKDTSCLLAYPIEIRTQGVYQNVHSDLLIFPKNCHEIYLHYVETYSFYTTLNEI